MTQRLLELVANIAHAQDAYGRGAAEERQRIADDLGATRLWLTDTMQSAFPDAQVFTAGRCDEGVRMVEQQAFDLALIDLGLPNGSWVTVVQALRARQPQALAVVVISTMLTSTFSRRCRVVLPATC